MTAYRGTCPDCGARTRLDRLNRGLNSRRCPSCASRRRRFWTREKIIERIQWWAETHAGVPPGAQRFQATKGCPGLATIYQNKHAPFRSWNEAIRAAGFTPLDPGQRRNVYGDDADGRAAQKAKAFRHTDSESSVALEDIIQPLRSVHPNDYPTNTSDEGDQTRI